VDGNTSLPPVRSGKGQKALCSERRPSHEEVPGDVLWQIFLKVFDLKRKLFRLSAGVVRSQALGTRRRSKFFSGREFPPLRGLPASRRRRSVVGFSPPTPHTTSEEGRGRKIFLDLSLFYQYRKASHIVFSSFWTRCLVASFPRIADPLLPDRLFSSLKNFSFIRDPSRQSFPFSFLNRCR